MVFLLIINTELQHVIVVVLIVVCVICCWLIGCVYGNQDNSNEIVYLDCFPVVKMDEIAMVRVMTHPMTIRWMTVFIHDNTLTDNEMCYDLIKLIFFFVRVNVYVCLYARVCVFVFFCNNSRFQTKNTLQ